MFLSGSELLFRKFLTLHGSRFFVMMLSKLNQISWAGIVSLSRIMSYFRTTTLLLNRLGSFELFYRLVLWKPKNELFDVFGRMQLWFQLVFHKISIQPEKLFIQVTLQQTWYIALMTVKDLLQLRQASIVITLHLLPHLFLLTLYLMIIVLQIRNIVVQKRHWFFFGTHLHHTTIMLVHYHRSVSLVHDHRTVEDLRLQHLFSTTFSFVVYYSTSLTIHRSVQHLHQVTLTIFGFILA